MSRLVNSLIHCLPLAPLAKAPVRRCGGSQVFENFYAISIRKSFFPEALSELLQRNRMP
ncbi:hypothetical protein [Marinobacter daqiaonensis]|uniref:hypothetical protein n=1 Tax=Marinobacter daqiaonensis TaxID=650891 RepID=UPI0015870E1B|nr:hypothetical protein [Marinobacter daqiaonensis]